MRNCRGLLQTRPLGDLDLDVEQFTRLWLVRHVCTARSDARQPQSIIIRSRVAASAHGHHPSPSVRCEKACDRKIPYAAWHRMLSLRAVAL
nr:hypothetical protein CFP56_30677 [Quercus suber]